MSALTDGNLILLRNLKLLYHKSGLPTDASLGLPWGRPGVALGSPWDRPGIALGSPWSRETTASLIKLLDCIFGQIQPASGNVHINLFSEMGMQRMHCMQLDTNAVLTNVFTNEKQQYQAKNRLGSETLVSFEGILLLFNQCLHISTLLIYILLKKNEEIDLKLNFLKIYFAEC